MQEQHTKKVVCKVSEEDAAELHRIHSEKQAAGEIMNDAVLQCRSMLAESIRQSNHWWADKADKYGFNVNSHLGFDAKKGEVFEIVPTLDEATILANSDPDSIQ
jgi:hypothetical protein